MICTKEKYLSTEYVFIDEKTFEDSDSKIQTFRQQIIWII